MSSLLALKQQQQGVQLQGEQIGILGAEQQQQQQTATQRTNIAQFFKNWDVSKHVSPDGTLDLDSILTNPELRTAAGDQFPQIAQQLIQAKQGQLQAKQQLVNLNDSTRTQFQTLLGGLRTDPDVIADNDQGRAKVQAAMGEFGSTGPDAARISGIYGQMINHAPQGKLVQMLSNFQLQAMDAATQSSAQRPNFMSTGSQAPNVNPQAPGGNLTGSAPLRMDLAPQVVTGPSGVPTVVKGSSAGSAATAGTSSGPVPTASDWQNFSNYQTALDSRVATASDLVPRAQMAEQALAQIRAGGGQQAYMDFARRLQAIGVPQSIVDKVAGGNLGAAQEAEKYLFQTTFAGLKQSMQGDPARVSEFQSAEQVFPSVGTDPRATRTVLNFMVQQAQRDYAEQQALFKARTGAKDRIADFNPATWQASYQSALRAGKVPGVPQSQVPGSTSEGMESKSRSGKPIVFRNGRWEYK